MPDILPKVLAALPLAVALHAPPVFAEVIDDIAIERHESGIDLESREKGNPPARDKP